MVIEKKNGKMETHKPHIAILPSPGMGHIIPLLEFAKRLVTDNGFCVSLIIFSTGSSPAQTQLLNSPSIPSDLEIVYLPPVEVPSVFDGENVDLITKLMFIVVETINKFLKSTLLGLRFGFPKALIIDMFCVNAYDIGKELSMPIYLFFTSSASLMSFLLFYPSFDESVNGDYSNLPESIRIPGCDYSWHVDDLVDDIMIREGISNMKRYIESDGILINTWEDLERSSVFILRENSFFKNLKTPPIYPIGPLIKSNDNDGLIDEFECLKWLNDQPDDSVLFISFGSGGTLSSEQMIELAYGLEQSKQKFIWVAKKPSDLSRSGSFFNVGIDENNPISYLPNGLSKKLETFGKFLPSWAPQLAILSHKSTGGFLTHCGWNSVLESIVNGVPMIAWPLFADQKMNASFLSSKEIGVSIRVNPKFVGNSEKKMVGRDEVERVIKVVMESEEGKVMRSRASVLQNSALKSQVGPSFDSLASLVHEWSLTRK